MFFFIKGPNAESNTYVFAQSSFDLIDLPYPCTSLNAVCTQKIYALNPDNATVSIRYCTVAPDQRSSCTPIQKPIAVGQHAGPIAVNDKTHIVYIGHPESGTVSVINGFTDKVAVGVIFNVNPPGSGTIKCDGTIYPTYAYIYVDSDTGCTAQSNKGFEFSTWTESPLTNRNSSIPLESSGNLTVNRYGIFTVNFKPTPPPIPSEY